MSATETYLGGFIGYSIPSERLPPTPHTPVNVFIKVQPSIYEGNFRIAGVAKRKLGSLETPTRARIVLMDEVAGNFVAQTDSDQNTGVYSFNNIANVKYTIMGFTDDGVPAVIADNIQPEPMP